MTERPLSSVIGATENTLGALLRQTLRGSGIQSTEQWVYLNLIAGGAPASVVQATLQLDNATMDELEKELIARGLLRSASVVSEHGADELATARVHVSEKTRLLTTGISQEHEDTARQVLDAIRTNAEKLLAPH